MLEETPKQLSADPVNKEDEVRLSEAVMGKDSTSVLEELKRIRAEESAPVLRDAELFKIALAAQAVLAPRDEAYAKLSGWGKFWSSVPMVTKDEILGLISQKTKAEELGEKLNTLCEAGILQPQWVGAGRYSSDYIGGYRLTELGADCLREAAKWNIDHQKPGQRNS